MGRTVCVAPQFGKRFSVSLW